MANRFVDLCDLKTAHPPGAKSPPGAGATTNTISVGASGDNGTTYRCYITDSNGNTVISEPVTIHTDPLGFTKQPEDCHCSPTGTATFSVEVYGTDVTYQWQWHSPSSTTWQNSGATGANTNSISLGASGDNGTVYRCVITDAAGNVAYSDPATVIPYAVTWEFNYNADGMRTYRSNGVTSYEYIYNGSQLTRLTITDELDGSQSVMAFAYDAAGKPLSLNYNGTRYIYATNIQGDVIAILNADGTAVVTYTYDAWGTPLSIGGTMVDTLGADNPLRYRGYVWDSETNLYYLQSRYYDPEVGRFINADGYVTTGQGFSGNNMFAYCNNNPVNFKDVSGTSATVAGGIVGAIFGFIGAVLSESSDDEEGGEEGIRWDKVWQCTASSAAAGALAGFVADVSIATCGAATAVLIAAGAGTVFSAANSAYTQYVLTDTIDLATVVSDAVLGGVTNGVCTGTSEILKPIVKGLGNGISYAYAQVSGELFFGCLNTGAFIVSDFLPTLITGFAAWCGALAYNYIAD